MYTKSELEGMTFKELKRLAREKSISQCWTSNSSPSHSIPLRFVLIFIIYLIFITCVVVNKVALLSTG
jgi:hypothetical protein